ncbi:hypothetical protein ACFQ7G_19880 [Streptomyces massasporeus]
MGSADDLSIVLVTLERGSDAVVLLRSDGKEARMPLGSSVFEPTSLISRVSYSPTFEGLIAETLQGDSIVFELPRFDGADQRAGRLVVYLDQNKWRLVSDAIQGRPGVSAHERAAALRLAGWSEQRKIILPVSSGHLYETTKWSNSDGRYRLGLTILQFSRGWQLADPLQVWEDELRGTLCDAKARDEEFAQAVTLAPNTLHSPTARGYVPAPSPADFPAELAFQHEALVSAVTQIDTMLDSELGQRGPDTGWAAANQRFSDELDSPGGDSQQKRKKIDARLVEDLRGMVAAVSASAGSTKAQQNWEADSQPALKLVPLPALGLLREMFHERHLNRGTKWEPNDVIDMVYLSCAAGYADFVVCERHMRESLARGVRRLGRKTQVYRNLAETVAAIETVIDTTE